MPPRSSAPARRRAGPCPRGRLGVQDRRLRLEPREGRGPRGVHGREGGWPRGGRGLVREERQGRPGYTSSGRSRPRSPHELAEHVGQDPSVEVVLDLDRRRPRRGPRDPGERRSARAFRRGRRRRPERGRSSRLPPELQRRRLPWGDACPGLDVPPPPHQRTAPEGERPHVVRWPPVIPASESTCWLLIHGAAAGRVRDRDDFARCYEP